MVLCLVFVVALILIRTIKKDFARYDHEEGLLDYDRDLGDEYGWKLVHGDVFRPPRHLTLLSSLVGVGMQLMILGFLVICITIAGELYVERATIITVTLFTYALTSTICGYISSVVYKRYSGKKWVAAMFVSATLWPFIVTFIAGLVNFVAISYNSSRAIPFSTMLAVCAIWLFLVVPLTILGSLIGRQWSKQTEFPVRVNSIPRPIPERAW